MEESVIKNRAGRPRQQIKKIRPPGIVLYEDTLLWFKEQSKQTGRSQSDLFQEACDLYILREERKKTIISL